MKINIFATILLFSNKLNNKSLSLMNKTDLRIIILIFGKYKLATNENESNFQVYLLRLFNLRLNSITIIFKSF